MHLLLWKLLIAKQNRPVSSPSNLKSNVIVWNPDLTNAFHSDLFSHFICFFGSGFETLICVLNDKGVDNRSGYVQIKDSQFRGFLISGLRGTRLCSDNTSQRMLLCLCVRKLSEALSRFRKIIIFHWKTKEEELRPFLSQNFSISSTKFKTRPDNCLFYSSVN